MDEELLSHWRLQYDREVYQATVGGKEYIFRALTLAEIEEISVLAGEGSSADAEDLYVQKAVLYPLDFDINKSIKAGYITRLAEEILQFSGAGDVSFIFENLHQARASMEDDVVLKMKAFIITAMPTVSEEELSNLTLKQLIYKVVLAETVMNFQQGVMGVENPDVQFLLQMVSNEPEQKSKRQSLMKGLEMFPEPSAAPLKSNLTKEELLRRIRSEDKETVDFHKVREVDQSGFENLDEDLLLKASGVLRPEDPIARRLRLASGG